MLFSDIRRQASVGTYTLATTSAAALTWLRRQTFPQLVDAPRFRHRSRAIPLQPELIGRLRELASGWSALAAAGLIAAVALALAVPNLAAPGADASVATSVQSSAGVTGSAGTRVEDLSATTFVGQLPFVSQLRYFGALDGSLGAGRQFVEGARQASLAQYLQDVNEQVVLPYLNDAASKKQQIDAWSAAVVEAQRVAQVEAAQRAAAEAQRVAALQPSGIPWRAPALAAGTVRHATLTFYACIGNGFCGNMASGQAPFEGAAACSADLPFGTRFIVNNDPSGRVFVCLDRGALAATWVDIWFYNAADGWAWQSLVGTSSAITILE